MCIAPKTYAKTHIPSCSIKEAKSNKIMNMPEDVPLQLILDEQVATFAELSTVVQACLFFPLS